MENKINIAELLKDCPKGMELNCIMFENTYFDYVDVENNLILCYSINDNIKTGLTFSKYGTYSTIKQSKCVIFPKGKTTWEGFVPPCKFKDGDIVSLDLKIGNNWIGIFKQYDGCTFSSYCFINGYGEFVSNPYRCKQHTIMNVRFAAEEEKQGLFDAIKANGYKWNAETKTLEKLSKFKVGDRIILKDNPHNIPSIRIKAVTKSQYILENEGFFYIDSTDEKYVLEDKFDINTLKPFDKVLVRNKSNEVWTANFYSHYDTTSDKPFICVGWSEMNEYGYCVPYEVNKHLLNTTNDCDNYYKTWEK